MAEGVVLSREAASWLAAALDDQTLFDFLVSREVGQGLFFKGFQVNVRNAGKPAVRNRVRSELLRSPELLSGLLECPGPWRAWCKTLAMFEEKWLLSHWRDLVRVSRRQDVVVALVVDARPAVAARGRRFLRLTRFWDRPPAASPASRIGGGLQFLAELLATPRVVPTDTPERAGGVVATERRVRVLDDQLAAARERLARERTSAQEAAARWTEERKKLQAENRDLRSQLHAVHRELERQLAQTDERVRAGAEGFQCRVLGLSEEVVHIREALAAAQVDRVQDRVEPMLEQHRRLNEKYGALSALRAELATLQNGEKRLLQCVEESVVVLPELHRLLADLRQRRDSLQALLPDAVREAASEGDLGNALLARVKGAHFQADWGAELDRVVALLEVPLVGELLGAAGLERLQRAASERHKVLARARPCAPELGRGQGGGASRGEPQGREIWDVAGALERRQVPASVWLVVDGYNTILGEPRLAAMAEQHGLAKAREEMVRLCRRRAVMFRGVEVVFDGAGPLSVRETLDGVTEVFAAQKQESQNADVYILGRITAMQPSVDAIWLVTSDQGLRRSVESCCNAFIKPSDFCRFLVG
ncbi:MAG: hypothetical protein A3K19_17925 [Lentisphaerae bacterium RIFOXYB12_FULL_65_16]|nr:MAG: hypothetical protein A3K18_11075 [Lentisphaerae bacterium RIFOXYA12_64_32]OGV87116.1 MAG: hypothetical protein A3K19_17925 [Lentisphaerae bacterium RIFOXYB12_FULL_65_16]